jgi:hypothetical protein
MEVETVSGGLMAACFTWAVIYMILARAQQIANRRRRK